MRQNLQTKFHVERPTDAQKQFLNVIRTGSDLLLRDRTGTGKSMGLAIALASRMAATSSQQTGQSLYIAPNQDLVVQISQWIKALYDGPAEHVQDNNITDMARTIVSTPGRLLDNIDALNPDCIVLDEADQALRLPKRYATLREIKKRQHHPKPTQILVEKLLARQQQPKPQIIAASATLNRPLRFWLASKGWVQDPIFVDIAKSSVANSHTKHYCLLVSHEEIRNIRLTLEKAQDGRQLTQADAVEDIPVTDERMIESIATLMELEPVHNGILFINTAISTNEVARELAKYSVRARDIRDYHEHKTETSTLWIATEFSARGMDIHDVSHVFILGRPSSPTGYLHMAGRTGRLGPHGFKQGKVFTLIQEKGRAEDMMRTMYNLTGADLEHYEYVQ